MMLLRPYVRVDGYTFDHVSEYIGIDKQALLLLWEFDADAYVTSLATLLHSLLIGGKIWRTPNFASRSPTLHAKLVKQLGVWQEEDQTHIEGTQRDTSPGALELVAEWESVKTAINESEIDGIALKQHLAGLVCRECYYDLTTGRRPARYYIDPLPLFKGDLKYLKGIGGQFLDALATCQMMPGSHETYDSLLADIPSMLTTHYLNFFDITDSHGNAYAPGATRLPLIQSIASTSARKDRVLNSLNLRMLKEAKSREDVIDAAVNWIATNERDVGLYRNLIGDDTTPELAREMRRELDSRGRTSHGARVFLRIYDWGCRTIRLDKPAEGAENVLNEIQRPPLVAFEEKNQRTHAELKARLHDLI